MKRLQLGALLSLAILAFSAFAFNNDSDPELSLKEKVMSLSEKVEQKVIEWRHHIHENPELSNREFKTSAYVAAHLKSLGMEVKTKIAHTGVVGILKGKKPGNLE